MLFNFLKFVFFLGAAFAIESLMYNLKWQALNRWYRTPISFILGLLSFIFFPVLMQSIYLVSLILWTYDSIVGILFGYFCLFIGNGFALYLGLFVYAALCKKTLSAKRAGILFFSICGIVLVLDTYVFFLSDRIFNGITMILSLCVGTYSFTQFYCGFPLVRSDAVPFSSVPESPPPAPPPPSRNDAVIATMNRYASANGSTLDQFLFQLNDFADQHGVPSPDVAASDPLPVLYRYAKACNMPVRDIINNMNAFADSKNIAPLPFGMGTIHFCKCCGGVVEINDLSCPHCKGPLNI